MVNIDFLPDSGLAGAQFCPVSQDGLSGSLSVSFWVCLASGRLWPEIGGWEIREPEVFADSFSGFTSSDGMSPASSPISIDSLSLSRPAIASASPEGPSTSIL